MKKKLGTVLLVVALALSFGLVAAPSVGANSVTGVGPMAIAPCGTIYAAVYNGTNWMVQKSNYGAHSWKETALNDAGGPIVQIVVSPNYRKDKTVYVAVYDPPTVYRLEEAGDDVVAFETIPAIPGATELYSIDVWTDEDDYNWILAANDIDVFAIEDRPFGDWFDQELNKVAYEVAFAPDCGFGGTYLIWAITESDDGDYLLTSTIDPGQWGQEIGDAEIDIDASHWVDLAFPEEYESNPDFGNTILFAALSSGDGGGVYLIEGIDADDGTSIATMLMDCEDIVSLAVSNDVILAGALSSPSIYRSVDGGESWSVANRQPTGECWTHVYMIPNDFAPITRLAYASTFGDEGGVFCSHDLGSSWKLVSNKLS